MGKTWTRPTFSSRIHIVKRAHNHDMRKGGGTKGSDTTGGSNTFVNTSQRIRVVVFGGNTIGCGSMLRYNEKNGRALALFHTHPQLTLESR